MVGLESSGGAGGGCLRLTAPDIEVWGSVLANGYRGQNARDSPSPSIVDGGAGGAGGGILMQADRVRLRAAAVINARGGAGGRGATYNPGGGGGGGADQCVGNGGGGGGGGRIKIFGGRIVDDGAIIDTRGGDGATGPQNDATSGQRGSVVVR